MKWVRRNTLVQPIWPRRYNPETMRYERDPDAKPYRSYSKWHILHEGRSDTSKAMSMCGQFSGLMKDCEVVEKEPESGRRSYRTQKVTCYYCRVVEQAL